MHESVAAAQRLSAVSTISSKLDPLEVLPTLEVLALKWDDLPACIHLAQFQIWNSTRSSVKASRSDDAHKNLCEIAKAIEELFSSRALAHRRQLQHRCSIRLLALPSTLSFALHIANRTASMLQCICLYPLPFLRPTHENRDA